MKFIFCHISRCSLREQKHSTYSKFKEHNLMSCLLELPQGAPSSPEVINSERKLNFHPAFSRCYLRRLLIIKEGIIINVMELYCGSVDSWHPSLQPTLAARLELLHTLLLSSDCYVEGENCKMSD